MNSSRFLKKLFTLGLSASTAVFASSYVLNLDSLQDDSASSPEADVTATGTAFGSYIDRPLALDQRQTGYLDSDGSVWAAGNNTTYGFGNNSTNNVTSFYQLRKNNSAVDNSASNPSKADETGYFYNVVDFSVDDHIIVIDEDGAVWSAGWNAQGQAGRGDLVNKTTFGVTNITSGAFRTETGPWHTLVVMDDGSVTGAGRMPYIGVGGTTSDYQTTFTETIDRFTTEAKRGIVDIGCGLTSSYILFGDGDLWYSSTVTTGTTGVNKWDLLGSNIKLFDIDSNGRYMYAVTTSNVVLYALATDTSFKQMATQPTEEVMQVRGGGNTSGMAWGYLTTSGDLYLSTTGYTAEEAYAYSQAKYVTNNVAYFDMAGSDTASGTHMGYLTTSGSLYLWGKNGLGQLGSGNTTDRAYTNPYIISGFIDTEDIPDINGGIVNTPPYAPKNDRVKPFLFLLKEEARRIHPQQATTNH